MSKQIIMHEILILVMVVLLFKYFYNFGKAQAYTNMAEYLVENYFDDVNQLWVKGEMKK